MRIYDKIFALQFKHVFLINIFRLEVLYFQFLKFIFSKLGLL